jgi:hypothetical protein
LLANLSNIYSSIFDESIPNESIVLVEAEVVKAPEPIRSCTVQDVELHIRKVD